MLAERRAAADRCRRGSSASCSPRALRVVVGALSFGVLLASSGSARWSARTTAASTSRRRSSTSTSGSACRSSSSCSATSGRVLDPWRAGRRGGSAGRASGSGSGTRRPFEYPDRLGPLAGRGAAPRLRRPWSSATRTRPTRGRWRWRSRSTARYLGRRGRVRLRGLVQERRRLRGRLHAPLADQPVRPPRGRPARRARRRSPASRSAIRRRGRSRSSR